MSSNPTRGPRPGPNQKGSVKRARQLLNAGVRTELVPPHRSNQAPPVPNVSHQTQWPLPDSGMPPRPVNQHPRFQAPRGPPPQRPPRPSMMAAPSTHPARSGQVSENSSGSIRRPAQSFSQPKPPPSRPVTNDSLDMNPHISSETEDLFRQSTASSTFVPEVPPFPPPQPPLPQEDPRQQVAGVVRPPTNRRFSRARRSSVSPIAEEQMADPRYTLGSFASSRAIPSSWGSGPPESEILGAYLDIDSDGDSDISLHDDSVTLVRNASVGKRGKPTMRTISKSNSTSRASALKTEKTDTQKDTPKDAASGAPAAAAATSQTTPQRPTPLQRADVSTASSESAKGVDPEKPPIKKRDSQVYGAGYEKDVPSLPQAAPAMSEKRPEGHKPPELDIGAVRNAEARGSLSSLTDLVRRATKLASNLERGKTASRADLTDSVLDFKAAFAHRSCNSAALSGILASFPPPGLVTPDEGRDSWPVHFGPSNLRDLEHLGSTNKGSKGSGGKAGKRRCCGMPKWLFILFCALVFIIVVLAVLLPVLLLVVPGTKVSGSSNSQLSCSQTTPCHNGGVSVSSGTQCSCVCANGYSGAQCTISSDGNCVTSQISNGSTTQNATMGNVLPRLFSDSSQKFNIPLDSITIMALFSKANVSCTTENDLVSFSEVRRNTHSTSQTRRFAPVELQADLMASGDNGKEDVASSPSVTTTEPTPVDLAARGEATLNGIVYYSSLPSHTPAAKAAPESSTTTNTTSSSTVTGATAKGVSEQDLEFSQIAVLFMLEKTGSLNVALDSESRIQSYLIDSYTTSSSLNVPLGCLDLPFSYSLDFGNKTITMPGGSVVGG